MKPFELLKANKSTIVKQWVDFIYKTYPADTQKFLKKQKDQFANPVGSTISKEIENLFDEFLVELDPQKVSPILDRIIRIRAIQDFTASQTLSFVFYLKTLVRETLGEELNIKQDPDKIRKIEERVDALALLAFDVYSMCRERLFEIRTRDAKIQVSGLLRRKGLVKEIESSEQDANEGNIN